MDINLFLLLLFCLLVVLTVFLIAIILELVKMFKSLRNIISHTDESIKPLLSGVNEIIQKVNHIMGIVEDTLEGIRAIGTVIKTTMGLLKKGGSHG
jgi:predicted PurR-regulated permease PerM